MAINYHEQNKLCMAMQPAAGDGGIVLRGERDKGRTLVLLLFQGIGSVFQPVGSLQVWDDDRGSCQTPSNLVTEM